MTASTAELLTSSPCGKRKRDSCVLSETTGEKYHSPNKKRGSGETSITPIPVFLDETEKSEKNNTNENTQPNTTNATIRSKRTGRIESLKKLKKRASLQGLFSPLLRQSLGSSQTETPSVVNIPGRRRNSLLHHHQEQQKKILETATEPKKTLKKHIDLRNSMIPGGPPMSPTLSRSMSLYSLKDHVEDPRGIPISPLQAVSRTNSHTPRPGPNPNKKKKRTRVSLSLRSTKKRNGGDVKHLFSSRGHPEVEEDNFLQTPCVKYFGEELTRVMNYQSSIPELSALKIPYLVSYCCNTIRHRYLSEEGLFRISPSWTELEDLSKRIQECSQCGTSVLQYPSDENEPRTKAHMYCGLIKKFLRDLPTPLLGVEYDEWVALSKELPEDVSNTPELQETFLHLLSGLPKTHFNLLNCLLLLCLDIMEHQESNKMSAENLSRVVGPNILWSDTISDPSTSSDHVLAINRLALWMILNYNDLFPDSLIGVETASSCCDLSEDASEFDSLATADDDQSSSGELTPRSALEHSEQSADDNDSLDDDHQTSKNEEETPVVEVPPLESTTETSVEPDPNDPSESRE